MKFVYTGTNSAQGMQEAILGMVDHTLAQAKNIARADCSVKGTAKSAGAIAALTTLRVQIAAIEIACK